MKNADMLTARLNRVIQDLKDQDPDGAPGARNPFVDREWKADRDREARVSQHLDVGVHYILCRLRDKLDSYEVSYSVHWNRDWRRPSVELWVERNDENSAAASTDLSFVVQGDELCGLFRVLVFDGARNDWHHSSCQYCPEGLADLVVAELPTLLESWIRARADAKSPTPIFTEITSALLAIEAVLNDTEAFKAVRLDVERRTRKYKGFSKLVPSYSDRLTRIEFEPRDGIQVARETLLDQPARSRVWKTFLLGRDAFDERFMRAVAEAKNSSEGKVAQTPANN